ncbi:MAG: type 1 glutamine amidotransferase [Chloroflexi bacterium]|nr:type 1 glutamine amidotransferase [Chloroflexota bacterium]
MMSVKGKKVAILVEDMYEELELWYPYYRLLEAGAQVTLVGPEVKTYASKNGYTAKATLAGKDARVSEFDAVIVPGGFAPDRLRRYGAILDLVRGVFEKGGVIGAICHAAWVPISAGIVKDKRATCVAAIKDDLVNAGATYVDQAVVVDDNLITSRTPADLPHWLPAIIAALSK